jgi:hypothetical protein
MSVSIGSSLPSLPVTTVAISTISNFKTKFVYNFYTPDELSVAPTIAQSNLLDPNTPGFSRNVPRYVELTWDKFQAQSKETVKQEFVDISIEQNAELIADENSLSLKYFGTYSQQELRFAQSIQSYLSSLWLRMGYPQTNASIPDVIKAIHEVTPEEIDQDFLNRYLNYATSVNITTETTSTDKTVIDNTENIVTITNVANRAFGNLFYDKVLNDSLMPVDRSSINNVKELFSRQTSTNEANNKLFASQYDVSVDKPISVIATDNLPYSGIVYQHIGYIVERSEINQGQETNSVTYYLEDPSVTSYFDTQVTYNREYVYRIRPIIAVQTMGYDVRKSVSAITTFLISGQKVASSISTLDETPPEPPTDFIVRWDYGLKKPVLTWNFPIDSRRHIKYFQVFRRRDIGNTRPAQLPFELVRMYDFNDLQNANSVFYNKPTESSSNERFSFLRGEDNIDSSIIINPNSAENQTFLSPTSYVDEEFDNEGYFIYSVACVDAHGISSNYSNQLGVSWNKQRNTIDLTNISTAGAPKPYPNLYLEKDVFVDTIKNEGFSQMTVVFNPEYMNVINNQGLDMQFLTTQPDSKYRIQLINTDLQQDQFFDFTIADDRINDS